VRDQEIAMSRVLIIDDEEKITRILKEAIASEGYDIDTCPGAEEALPLIEKGNIDIILCDLRLGGMDGLELLRRSGELSPGTDFVMMTAYASSKTAVEAMRLGAYEYLVKPFQIDEVTLLLRRISERRELMIENIALKEKISSKGGGRILGDSKGIRSVLDLIGKVAPTTTPVLITGESGTGKELVAVEIHSRSSRASKPFIIINCAAVPDNLLEAELFGHEKGAFTGAVQKKPGQFRLAHGGSLFLDEIGEMPLALQAKLLRAIENGEFIPLGGTRPVNVDVRIITATNRDLETLAATGGFRQDLFYRLNVFPIQISPLRSRKEDILPIARAFLSGRASSDEISGEVIEALEGYSWPGNVRELRNVLERAVILSGGDPVEREHILIPGERPNPDGDGLAALIGKKSLEEIEKSLIEMALEKAGGNKSKAAELLGITRRTLYSRMEKYGLGKGGEE
jgi:DNA-binding NtrC family response regulator